MMCGPNPSVGTNAALAVTGLLSWRPPHGAEPLPAPPPGHALGGRDRRCAHQAAVRLRQRRRVAAQREPPAQRLRRPARRRVAARLGQLGVDLAAHLFVRANALGLSLLETNDVEAELGLHHVADLAGLERERGLLELAHHAAAPEPPEVARARRGA